jgi:hydrogenase/urease accessory protein HupE
VEHIVLGADHVLFLVTIIVAGAGWRYWLAVLTSFTLAHSITLTLGLLGWVKVNPAVVEPLIAASIVLMALLNLFNLIRHNGQATSTARQTAVVFACGLLHGLGFASSMADMGLHGNYQLASLLGFNLGIELGQALCLVVVLAVLRGATWATGAFTQRMQQVPALASLLATVVGSYWVLERLA